MAAGINTTFATEVHVSNPLELLTLDDLAPLYDAVRGAGNCLLAVMNEPGTKGRLAHMVEDEWERFNRLGEQIVDEVRRRKPTNWREESVRLRLLLSRNIGEFDTPLDVVQFVYSIDGAASQN